MNFHYYWPSYAHSQITCQAVYKLKTVGVLAIKNIMDSEKSGEDEK